MTHDREQVLKYWNKDEVESMYDKNLLNAEIELIKQRIPRNTKVLDVGCGEGEGTLAYSYVPGVLVQGVDFSQTRLRKAAERLKERQNVTLQQVDLLGRYHLENDYDIIVSQRFLINLMEWKLQSKVLLELMAMLKPGGRLLMLEGSQQGVSSLNEFRAAWGLDPIPVKWHNLFLDDHVLVGSMQQHGYELVEQDGLGAYFLLTRGIRPTLDNDLNWDSEFNRMAANRRTEKLLGFGTRFSRLKLWVFQK